MQLLIHETAFRFNARLQHFARCTLLGHSIPLHFIMRRIVPCNSTLFHSVPIPFTSRVANALRCIPWRLLLCLRLCCFVCLAAVVVVCIVTAAAVCLLCARAKFQLSIVVVVVVVIVVWRRFLPRSC